MWRSDTTGRVMSRYASKSLQGVGLFKSAAALFVCIVCQIYICRLYYVTRPVCCWSHTQGHGPRGVPTNRVADGRRTAPSFLQPVKRAPCCGVCAPACARSIASGMWPRQHRPVPQQGPCHQTQGPCWGLAQRLHHRWMLCAISSANSTPWPASSCRWWPSSSCLPSLTRSWTA